MRNSGREIPRTDNCNQPADIFNTRVYKYLSTTDKVLTDKIYSIHNLYTHIQLIELRSYIILDTISLNRGLRVKYLLNQINDSQFKRTLQINEKQNNKNLDFRNIIEMFINVSMDLLRNVYDCIQNNTRFDILVTIEAFTSLVEYVNENLKKIGKKYNCVYPGICINTISWKTNYEKHLQKIASN